VFGNFVITLALFFFLVTENHQRTDVYFPANHDSWLYRAILQSQGTDLNEINKSNALRVYCKKVKRSIQPISLLTTVGYRRIEDIFFCISPAQKMSLEVKSQIDY
jgi:hypothetical protein